MNNDERKKTGDNSILKIEQCLEIYMKRFFKTSLKSDGASPNYKRNTRKLVKNKNPAFYHWDRSIRKLYW